MAVTQNGYANGLDGHDDDASTALARFSHIPAALDVPLSSGDAEEAVEVNLEDLMDDPTELCTLLENENVARGYWMTIALAYAKQQRSTTPSTLSQGASVLCRATQSPRTSCRCCHVCVGCACSSVEKLLA